MRYCGRTGFLLGCGLGCDSLGRSDDSVNVCSDVFAVRSSLSVMARLRKVIVSSVAVAEIDKAYCFPILRKELFAALESPAMRSLWIRIARERRLVIGLHDCIAGKDPRVVEATFQNAGGAIGIARADP